MSHLTLITSDGKPTRARIQPKGGANGPAAASEADAEKIIYHITHDLRSSLRAIKTLPVWLRDDLTQSDVELSEDVESSLGLLVTHSNRIDQMLLDLLDYSRVGRLSTPAELLHVETEIDAVLDSLNLPSGFEIRRMLDATEVWASQYDFAHIVKALLSNAYKHHDDEYGVIRIASWREAQRFRLSVTDDGPGIAPEHRERIFEMLSTLRSRDDVEGSGMGLAVARKAAVNMGGNITVHDVDDGRGVCFVLCLPQDR